MFKARQSNTVLRTVAITMLALSTLGLSACAVTPSSESDIVVKRAQARWDAVTSGDLETAYTYYSPGFRSANSLIDYGVSLRMRRVAWTSATYLEHDCEESRCLVRFDVGFKVANPVPGLSVYESSNKVEDTWIKTNGQWWYLPEK